MPAFLWLVIESIRGTKPGRWRKSLSASLSDSFFAFSGVALVVGYLASPALISARTALALWNSRQADAQQEAARWVECLSLSSFHRRRGLVHRS
jgi:hypothetical protein